MAEGYIKLYRNIQDNWTWKQKPFSRGQAWIDLVLSANHNGNKFLLGNELVEIERGQFITSEPKLSKRWGWSRSKVRAFLLLLETDSMIVKKSDNKKTTLTICNYSVWQDMKTAKEQQKDRAKTGQGQDKNTNKNVKNVKNDKNVKESNNTCAFEMFWEAYPKKKSKGQAEATFKKIAPDEQLLEAILESIGRARKSPDWTKEDGRYIPYPATWLNAQGWLDEYAPPKSGNIFLDMLKEEQNEQSRNA